MANDATLWALTDNLNTVRDLAEAFAAWDGDTEIVSTTLVTHQVFDAFGNMTYSTPGGPTCLFGFTGQMYDTDTHLQNNLNRWYDPTVGRWLSEDPKGLSAGDANLYRSCGNNPIRSHRPHRAGADWWPRRVEPGPCMRRYYRAV